MQVSSAVIPAAGAGTRFLPATKAVPKELMPIGDTPAIQLIIDYDEVSSSGPVSAVSRLVTKRFETTGQCVAASDVVP